MDTICRLRNTIIKTGIELLDKGLITGTWGNISACCSQSQLVAITPSGRDYRTLCPEDIVIVDYAGKTRLGCRIPSSELPLHLAIYKARPDIKAVVHTHSIFASACSVARKPILPIIEDLIQVNGGTVEIADYALPGTEQLAQNAITALGAKSAVLLANHGVIGCGQTLGEASLVCELVEKAAQIYIYANQLGGASVLSNSDVTAMHGFYQQHYRKRKE